MKVAVSIIPAHDTQPEYAEKLRDWQREDPTVFDSKTFAEILREVTSRRTLTFYFSYTPQLMLIGFCPSGHVADGTYED